MNTNIATEYRNLPLSVLTEYANNPRHIFEDSALKELAESICSQGVLSPLLVRPLYAVDTDAVALKVKQEFAAKQKARKTDKPETKPQSQQQRPNEPLKKQDSVGPTFGYRRPVSCSARLPICAVA